MMSNKQHKPTRLSISTRAMLPIVMLIFTAAMAVFFSLGAVISQYSQRNSYKASEDQKKKSALLMSSVMIAKKAEASMKESMKMDRELATPSQAIGKKNSKENELVATATEFSNKQSNSSPTTQAPQVRPNAATTVIADIKRPQQKPFELSSSVVNQSAPAKTTSPSTQPATRIAKSQVTNNNTMEAAGERGVLSNINQEAMRAQIALAEKSISTESSQAAWKNQHASANAPSISQTAKNPGATTQAASSTSPSHPVKINVTSEMVVQANKTNKIEAINSANLGVSKINPDVVLLKNGGSIRVGEKFPSGETLLSLDPENGQIVTSKRTLLLF